MVLICENHVVSTNRVFMVVCFQIPNIYNLPEDIFHVNMLCQYVVSI